VYEFVSLGDIKGYHDEIAPKIEEKKEQARAFGVNVREILFTTAKSPVDYPETNDYSPQLVILFEAPDDKTAMRFAKSLYPYVKGQILLNVTRKPSHSIWFRSEAEVQSFNRANPR
jgi:hypothetical protein